MRLLINILILALVTAGSATAFDYNDGLDKMLEEGQQAPSQLKQSRKGMAEELYEKTLKDRKVTESEKKTDLPAQSAKAEEEFSGNYVFDGKVYYYNQETGEFRPVDNSSAGNEDQDALASSPDDFFNQIDQPSEIPALYEKQWPISLASLARGAEYDGEIVNCQSWGSGLIKNGPFESKERCEDELSKEKEHVLKVFDDYIESFEKRRTELMVNSELAEYEKLSKIKLSKQNSLEMVLKAFQRGCICVD